MSLSRIFTVGYLNRSSQFLRPKIARTLSTNANLAGNDLDGNQNSDTFESGDDFERRIFSGLSGGGGDSKNDVFFQRLDRLGRAHDKSSGDFNGGSNSHFFDGLDESFSTLSDGMDGELKEAAQYFEFEDDEVMRDGYCFRPDMVDERANTYDLQDLDLTKVAVSKGIAEDEFYVTTKEALMKADFRNVRFLANFITEAGIINKRSQTKISAKAQRKIAREIKTARAFGLMPFTTMGTKSFVFGKTMQDLDEDFEYETYDGRLSGNGDENEPLGA